MIRTFRHVHLVGAAQSAALLTAVYNGVEHVPVIAMVEGVVWAQNAATPELVTAEALARAPQGWNGRPIVGDHPRAAGQHISAATPQTLERNAFGTIFNATMSGTKLCVEAWIDPVRAAVVGADALRVLERLYAHDIVDVSVGCFVISEPEKGVYNGQTYTGRWTHIVPDHLAMLPEGTPGACSIAAGCGAPRAAALHQKGHPMSVQTLTIPRAPDQHAMVRAAARRARRDASMSDAELRTELIAQLSRTPGFIEIVAVYPDDGTVIHSVRGAGGIVLESRTYEVDGQAGVQITGDPVRVEQAATYTPKAATTREARAGSPQTIPPAPDQHARVRARMAGRA